MKSENLTREVFGYFLTWFISIIIFIFLASSLLPKIISSGPIIQPVEWAIFWKSFANWDGGHYIGIAQNGYVTNYQYAFFPLYPLIIKGAAYFFKDYLLSALLISWFSLFLSILFFVKLLLFDFKVQVIEKAVIYFLIFPASIFFIVAYSESFFLLLTVSTFYLIRLRRWFVASVIIALASATRPIGIILIIPLAFELFYVPKFKLAQVKKTIWVLLVAPLGLFFYMWFLNKTTGSPLTFITAQEHWQRLPTLPLLTFATNYIEVAALKNIGSPFFAQQFINFAAIMFAIALSIAGFFKLRPSYFIFISLSTLLPLATASTVSYIRLILPVFPIFIILAIWGQNRMFNFFWLLFSTLMFALISILFINGYWIA